MANLVTLAQVQTALPTLTEAETDDLSAAIAAASRAVESYCGRPLALAWYDETYRPDRRRTIRLRARPVVELTRVSTDLTTFATITNGVTATDPFASALVRRDAAKLYLSKIVAGVATTTELTLASYAMMSTLATAVNAVGGGWSCVVAPGAGTFATALLARHFEAQGAARGVELRGYLTELSRYELDASRGVVRLTESHPDPWRYADRTYYDAFWGSSDPRTADVRVVYRAGYAVDSTDVNAGLEPMPADVARATILTVRGLLDTTASPNLKKESDGVYSYELFGAATALTDQVKALLGPWIDPLAF